MEVREESKKEESTFFLVSDYFIRLPVSPYGEVETLRGVGVRGGKEREVRLHTSTTTVVRIRSPRVFPSQESKSRPFPAGLFATTPLSFFIDD